MTDLFKDWIPSLLHTKRSIITTENEKEYKPYIVNRSISQHNDTILYVNEMNRYHNLENKLQYDFYLFTLKSKKRPFQKWYKTNESDDIQCVKEYFGYSSEKAKEALRILTPLELETMKKILHKGGIVK